MYTLRMYFHPNTFLHVPPTAILDPTSDLKADQEPQKPQQDVVISPACLLIPPSWPAYSSCLFFFFCLPQAMFVSTFSCTIARMGSGVAECLVRQEGLLHLKTKPTHPPFLAFYMLIIVQDRKGEKQRNLPMEIPLCMITSLARGSRGFPAMEVMRVIPRHLPRSFSTLTIVQWLQGQTEESCNACFIARFSYLPVHNRKIQDTFTMPTGDPKEHLKE